MKLGIIRLAFKHWRKDLRSNETKLLIVATLLAAVSMSMISSFSDRLSRTMHYRASELIAGDLTVWSSRAISNEYSQYAKQQGLLVSEALGFSTMAFAHDELQLVRVRAVENNYPLKGFNQVANEFYGQGQLVNAAPQSGKVWVEERVLQKLNASIGDSLEIGNANFSIEKILQQDADRSGSLFSPFGRILMNKADVDRTGVIGQGSRIFYKVYFSGQEKTLNQFAAWLEPKLEKSEKMAGIKDSQNNVSNALGKAQQYLSLASLISVLLATVAIALCAQRYSERHFNSAALFRCLGASSQFVKRVFIYKLLFTAFLGAILGALIGFLLHYLLLAMVADLLPKDLMDARLLPVFISMFSAAMVLVLVALAPILKLNQVSPIRVLRRELNPTSVKPNVFFILALAIMVSLAYLLTGSLKLSVIFVLGLGLLLLIYGVLSTAMLAVLLKLKNKLPGFFVVGLTQLNRHQYYARSQIAAFAFIFTSVALIWIVRGDLFDNWQAQVPDGTPNHFAINILPDKKADFEAAMTQQGLPASEFYPMVRGRLSHINGIEVDELFPEDAPEAVQRELNLSWSENLRADEAVEAGEWFTALDRVDENGKAIQWISMESGLAKRLNIQLNDTVRFNLVGEEVETRVANLRSVKWENFRPNFYVVFTPEVLSQYHHTYINSFYLPAEQSKWLISLNKQFKAVTIIEIQQILTQVREILSQTSIAVEAILLLVLLCAMVLMFATLLSTLNLRKHEAALYRTFGASEKMLKSRIRSEYICLAFISSLLALLSFEMISVALYEFIFNVNWQPHFVIWISLPLLSLGSILLSGFVANRDVLKASPRQLLQDIS